MADTGSLTAGEGLEGGLARLVTDPWKGGCS